MLTKGFLFRASVFGAAAFLAFAPSARADESELFIVAEHCTNPSLDAHSITDKLKSVGWLENPDNASEAAAKKLGDGALLMSRVSDNIHNLRQFRNRNFIHNLARINRKTSDYFYSATLQSPDLASIVNIYWSKQGNRLQCFAASSSRNDIEALGVKVASMTETGGINDFGPSWQMRSATGPDRSIRVTLSVLKQDTIALFSADPLTATVGMFAEYFPRRD